MATLLSWGGYAVSELDVIAAFDRVGVRTEVTRRDGFSITELITAVRSLKLGVVAIDSYLTPEELKQAVAIEPLIVRLAENSGEAGFGRGHFTIVDGFSINRGFRRADSADGTYTFHKEESFIAAALFDSPKQGSRIPVIYLRRGTSPVARSLPLTAAQNALLPDIARSRLLEAIDPITSGTTQITLNVGFGRVSLSDPSVPGVQIRESGRSGSLQVRHGLDRSTDLTAEILLSSSNLGLAFDDGTTIPIGREAGRFGPLVIGVNRRIDLSLPRDWRVVSGVTAQLHAKPRLANMSGHITALWQLGEEWSLHAGGALSVDKGRSRLLYTSALNGGVVRHLSPRLAASAEVSMRVPLNYSGPKPVSIGGSIHRAFGSQWAAEISFEKTVLANSRSDTLTFGIGITYQFSRPLGR